MDIETRCKCGAFRYFDVNNQGSDADPWLCETCELARLRQENADLKAIILKTVERDSQWTVQQA